MNLNQYRHLWGYDLPWPSAFAAIAAEGYSGVEARTPDIAERPRFVDGLRANGLAYIAMAFTAGPTVEAHVESLRTQLGEARAMGAVQVTAHSGVDAWSATQAEDFFGSALEAEAAAGIRVAHETHRGRILFNPWATRDLLRKFPALNLCCDFSHFACVAGRLDWDDGGIVALCAERCLHLHARVGYAEGPQVPDPSAPEYAGALAAHETWWDAVWSAQRATGRAAMTVTPEFGPPGYLHTLPHTNVPVADLAGVVRWMAERLKARYGSDRGAW